jgi:hypothetical protein
MPILNHDDRIIERVISGSIDEARSAQDHRSHGLPVRRQRQAKHGAKE